MRGTPTTVRLAARQPSLPTSLMTPLLQRTLPAAMDIARNAVHWSIRTPVSRAEYIKKILITNAISSLLLTWLGARSWVAWLGKVMMKAQLFLYLLWNRLPMLPTLSHPEEDVDATLNLLERAFDEMDIHEKQTVIRFRDSILQCCLCVSFAALGITAALRGVAESRRITRATLIKCALCAACSVLTYLWDLRQRLDRAENGFDPVAILGVNPGAGWQTIDQTYWNLRAQVLFPNIPGNDVYSKILAAQRAYEILSGTETEPPFPFTAPVAPKLVLFLVTVLACLVACLVVGELGFLRGLLQKSEWRRQTELTRRMFITCCLAAAVVLILFLYAALSQASQSWEGNFDPYVVLELDQGEIDNKAIKKAFRKISIRLHPD